MVKYLYLLILFFYSCSSVTIGAYTIQNEFETMNKMKTFDIKTYNEKSVNGMYEFETDSGKVRQIKYFDDYMEYVYPKGQFYDILNVYYPNGKIKEHGFRIEGLKVGKWEFYDKQGNVTIVDEDAKFDGFDYNTALLFLHKKGYINLDNGAGVGNFTLGYNSKTKTWIVEAKDKDEKWLLYKLTGKNGFLIF